MAQSLFTTILSTLLLSIKFLKLSFGEDALLPNQTIRIGQTLISRNQDFELGFFSPGKSQDIFLGIWYKNTPHVVVWVANRYNVISDSQGVTFFISVNGSLAISRNGSIIWSANESGAASNLILQLLDNGNLVLVNETTSSKGYIWQRYILPGMMLVDDPDAAEVRGLKHPDMLEFWFNTSMSLDECQAECLKNCSCTAYVYPHITNGGSGCVMWFGDLINTRHLPGADTKQNTYVRLPLSQLDDYSTPESEKEKKRPTRLLLILISIATGVILSGFINVGIFMIRRPKKQAIKMNNEDLELPLLKFARFVATTNNFSKENMIEEGDFGPVYKGILPSKEEIAIKRLSRTSGQCLEEFKNEAILIAKLQHTNLVRLWGCFIEGEERMLIYEYLQNKSLDYQNRRKLLTWPNRFNIVMGIARGLLYLHRDSRLKIIH
ncbi:hypothetical protein ACS0TY_012188 [Phlomoides rotata]